MPLSRWKKWPALWLNHVRGRVDAPDSERYRRAYKSPSRAEIFILEARHDAGISNEKRIPLSKMRKNHWEWKGSGV